MLDLIAAFEQWAVNGENFSLYLGVMIIAATFSWRYAFRNLHRARLIENVPTSKVRSAAQGYVELIGHARAMDGPETISPVSKRKCLWYRYSIEERRRSKKSFRWYVIDKGVSTDLFLLEDETGHCIIDPDNAEVLIRERHIWYGNEPFPTRPRRPPSTAFGFERILSPLMRYRYCESYMEEYEPLYAIGNFHTVGGGENLMPLGDEARELIAKWKHDPGVLAKFDVNKDGRIDLEEWEALRKAAHQEVMQARLRAPERRAVNVLRAPESDRPFILSVLDPKKMTNGYRLKTGAFIVCAVFISVLSVYALQLRLI